MRYSTSGLSFLVIIKETNVAPQIIVVSRETTYFKHLGAANH